MNIAETGFWQGNDTDKHHAFDSELANSLGNLFKGNLVIDLGCGEGKYVYALRHQKDTLAYGIDGNPSTARNNPFCLVRDLTEPLPQSIIDFDKSVESSYNGLCVLSLEVGEHIPKELCNVFVNNIKVYEPKIIVISWAIPGQGGDGHVNELPNQEVIKMFSEYEYDVETSQKLRNAATLWWFKNTIMVFKSSQQDHNKG
jgi:hypothetical protein